MDQMQTANEIAAGKGILGIEFGSTRIKAVLINSEYEPVAQGAFDWENSLVDGMWTYSLEEVAEGLRQSFCRLKNDVREKYAVKLTALTSIGISAMMHGYLAFDSRDNLLVPFRTWRNTVTARASRILTEEFRYPVPERWSVSHLYQAILNNEAHVRHISFLTTLAGYVHWRLTGQKVLGIGDASGMFPVDISEKNYNRTMLARFDGLTADKKYPWKLERLLPDVLTAGMPAGRLTAAGARLLDPDGDLEPGALFAPPEGDAGTGMTATNCVLPRTGTISAGTSVFAMVVLEKELSRTYKDRIDLVTTPDGALAAMAHANNCTGEYDHWIRLFAQAVEAFGVTVGKSELYDTLLSLALAGDKDCGGLIPYNYISGESMTGLSEGRPLFVRTQKSNFTLANFMRAQLFSALAVLRTGMDILFDAEHVQIDRLCAHGGFFKTAGVGLAVMAAAMHTPVSALKTAGEGGPWGMAILAAYTATLAAAGTTPPGTAQPEPRHPACPGTTQPDTTPPGTAQPEPRHPACRETTPPDTTPPDTTPLGTFLAQRVFAASKPAVAVPEAADIDGFNTFFENYKKGLAIEKAAVSAID